MKQYLSPEITQLQVVTIRWLMYRTKEKSWPMQYSQIPDHFKIETNPTCIKKKTILGTHIWNW